VNYRRRHTFTRNQTAHFFAFIVAVIVFLPCLRQGRALLYIFPVEQKNKICAFVQVFQTIGKLWIFSSFIRLPFLKKSAYRSGGRVIKPSEKRSMK
jgi:hypothetical protein